MKFWTYYVWPANLLSLILVMVNGGPETAVGLALTIFSAVIVAGYPTYWLMVLFDQPRTAPSERLVSPPEREVPWPLTESWLKSEAYRQLRSEQRDDVVEDAIRDLDRLIKNVEWDRKIRERSA